VDRLNDPVTEPARTHKQTARLDAVRRELSRYPQGIIARISGLAQPPGYEGVRIVMGHTAARVPLARAGGVNRRSAVAAAGPAGVSDTPKTGP
jgi:hypothetical protein